MTTRRSSPAQPRPISAHDVGRFLRGIAGSLKDPRTGNPAMSEALLRLSEVMLDEKFQTPSRVAERLLEQGNFDFQEEIDFSSLSTDAARDALNNDKLGRTHLIVLGTERFGIARSRLEKISRDEIARVILAAIQHEESLGIISEEARRGGQTRSS